MKNKLFDYTPTDGTGTYEVCYGDSITELAICMKGKLARYNSPMFIVDENLPKEFLSIVEKICGCEAKNIIYINPEHKTIDRIQSIWTKMVQTVPSIAIVIGGGTICDLAGFACATYQRGLPRIIFPTTVLSMVDASIGGKSGIDFANVKNSIGAIHYPITTVNCIPFLKNLDRKEYNAGFAEIIKAAILYDRSFFNKLYNYSKIKNNFETNETLDIFFISSRIKAKVCEEENKEKVSLLYGHSVGHAIERYNSMHLRHGDCVAIGMTIEGAMACLLGIWHKEEWLKQQEVIDRFGLPTRIPDYIDLSDLTKKMMLYKKLVDEDNYLFSLPKTIGKINNQETTFLTPVKKSDMVKVLEKTLEWIKDNK